MDYKYIEQLLERYWNCETSLEEEKILRSFFAQKDVPVRLLPYRELFVGQSLHEEEHLGADFDKRILALTEDKNKKTGGHRVEAKQLTRTYRLRPFFQAAASVAVVLCLGMAVEQASSLHTENQQTEVVVTTSTQSVSPTATPETAYGEVDPLQIDTTIIKTVDVNL